MKTADPLLRTTLGRLAVEVHRGAAALDHAAATACVDSLEQILAEAETARVILDLDVRQRGFLAAVKEVSRVRRAVDWRRVTILPLASAVGKNGTGARGTSAREEALAALGATWLPLAGERPAAGVANARPAAAVGRVDGPPVDLACLGIGVDGRLGRNGPAAANFEDTAAVKWVDDDTGGGWTLTLPVLRRARRLVVTVASSARAPAVRAVLQDAITTACPATLLRLHPAATLYLERQSASLARLRATTTGRRPAAHPFP